MDLCIKALRTVLLDALFGSSYSLNTNARDFSLADFSVSQDGVISSTRPNGSAFDCNYMPAERNKDQLIRLIELKVEEILASAVSETEKRCFFSKH
jgi:hypothetical protein